MNKLAITIGGMILSGVMASEITREALQSEFESRASELGMLTEISIDGYHASDYEACYTWQDIELIVFGEIQE
jgi:hypothetical protein